MKSELWPLLQSASTSHFTASEMTQMGLGWHIQKRNGKTLIWHRGETLGQASFVGIDPHEEIGVVMLSNAAFSGCCCDLAVWQLDEKVIPQDHQKASFIEGARLNLQRYEGEYAYAPQVSMHITAQEDYLRVEVNGARGGSMYPVSETEFITKDRRVHFSFVEDDGLIIGFRLMQHGIEQIVSKRGIEG